MTKKKSTPDMTPSEAALKTQAQLAKIGRIEIWQQFKLVHVRHCGKLKDGEPFELHAAEPTLLEAMMVLARQASGRLK